MGYDDKSNGEEILPPTHSLPHSPCGVVVDEGDGWWKSSINIQWVHLIRNRYLFLYLQTPHNKSHSVTDDDEEEKEAELGKQKAQKPAKQNNSSILKLNA